MRLIRKLAYTLTLTGSLFGSIAVAQQPELQTFGQVEPTQLEGSAEIFSARIDTGATTSSINAQQIQAFKKDGKDYVTFLFPQNNGDTMKMKKEVVRWASIRQANTSITTLRPVVELEVEINGETIVAEFSLKDRSHMTYPVLIGRNILAGRAIVDVSENVPNT